jgi:hypothetical protein
MRDSSAVTEPLLRDMRLRARDHDSLGAVDETQIDPR